MVFILFLFYPLSVLYQVIFYFNQKRKKPINLLVDLTISVGNLSVGGTGKTPFTIHLTKLIKSISSKSQISILSRGYGSKLSKAGARVEIDSLCDQVGDEPFMIKNQVKEAEVIIGSNRIESFQKFSILADVSKSYEYKDSLEKKNNSNINQKNSPDQSKITNKILILDDGFQHIAIARDIDIVLVDGMRPLENGFTLPIGKLRETENALKRADLLIFTRCKRIDNQLLCNTIWQKHIHEKFPKLKIFHALETKLGYFHKDAWMNSTELDQNHLYGNGFLEDKNVLAFCGLGSPSSFFQAIQDEKPKELEMIEYKDHYSFPDRELEGLFRRLQNFDILVCTEKDFVKIISRIKTEFQNRIFFLRIQTEIVEESEWLTFWKSVLDSKNPK
jgi:tetraacyldisaccharide 4'-kinase